MKLHIVSVILLKSLMLGDSSNLCTRPDSIIRTTSQPKKGIEFLKKLIYDINTHNTFCISIDGSLIENVPSAAFTHFSRLKKLRLRNNSLSSIDLNAFIRTEIQFLDLNHNSIKEVPNFEAIADTLKVLTMCDNGMENQASLAVKPNTGNFSKLREVNFCNNKLVEVPQLVLNAPNIEVINLHGNHLEDLPLLHNFKKLHTLDVSKNKINSIGIDSFKDTKISILNLNWNLITQLSDLSSIKSLTNLTVQNNPLVCVEKNTWLCHTTLCLYKNGKTTPLKCSFTVLVRGQTIQSKTIELCGSWDMKNEDQYQAGMAL